MSGGDSRFVPKEPGASELRERGSRFLGFARKISSPEQAKALIGALAKEFHDATHVCFAWYIGGATRAADAGEPPGTAGKPILSAIRASGLEEVCVAVVRYFGGTKLGTAGLSRCYREAARAALDAAGRVEVFETEELAVVVPYEKIDPVRRIFQALGVEIDRESFSETAEFALRVRKSRAEELRRRLAEEKIGPASPSPSSPRFPRG